MYKLYWDRGSANMAPHAVLCDIGRPFELIRIDAAKGENRRADYMQINPHARVPTLVDDGKVMYEAAAICLYLCEQHPKAALMPAVGDAKRHLFLQWMVYLTNTVQEDLMHWFHADNYADSESARTELKIVAERRLGKIFSHIDSSLGSGGPYLLGETFSAADYYLVMLCRWARAMQRPATRSSSIRALVELVTQRPGWRAMMVAEGTNWDGDLN